MKITMNNRIPVLMRQRKINSASEFARRMTAAGYPLSRSHASRYEKNNPPAFDQRFIEAVCNVLCCLPDDLYEIVIELEPGEELNPYLALPPHAIVRQKKGKAGFVQNEEVAEVPEPVAKKRETPRKSLEESVDTGPIGVLFPFAKV
jgi:DNA-binding Xre family transcriptional regulator